MLYLCIRVDEATQPTGRVSGTENDKTMEKEIARINYVVGWSTKQANTFIRRSVRYFETYADAFEKYIAVGKKKRVIYCYLNKRTEYTDGSVKIERIYFY